MPEQTRQYQIRRLLGEGGCGRVFEAWDQQLCRSVALKRLKSAMAPDHSSRLLSEARSTAALKHSAFVQVFSIDGVGNDQSIVMELVLGQTLRQYLKEHSPSWRQALDIVYQVADAMAEAHSAGLVHGDIKPSNLMLEDSGKVRILDFGLAHHIDPNATQSSTSPELQGTIAYMAPERLLGHAPGGSGDVYALGVLLYEMAAGARPFAGLQGLALAAAHMQSSVQQWPMPEHIGAAGSRLIRAMAARNPGERPPSMRAIMAEIDALRGAGGDQLPARAPLAAVPHLAGLARLRPLQRPWLIGAAAALLLLALLAARWSGMLGGAAPPYSEAAEMQAGLTALHQFDRPANQSLAMASFSNVLAHNPSQASAAAGLGLIYSLRYIDDGRDDTWLQRADASAQQALRLDQQLALAHAALAWVREFQGRRAEALAAADAALRLEPRNPEALFGKIRLLIQAHQFSTAQAVLAQASAWYPQSHLFSSQLGTLRYRQGDYTAAEQVFRRTIALAPEASSGYAGLSQALLRQNRGDEALQVLQRGLQLTPDWTLYTNLGTALFARGDYSAALQAFERAVSPQQGNPRNYLLWANLADSERWIPGQQEAARHAYRQAVSLLTPLLRRAPQDATFNSRMGLYLARLGQPQAIALAQQAIALAPDTPDTHFRAAVTYELGDRRAAALEALGQALALGYPVNLIESEPDLLNLRRDSRYLQLLTERERSK